MSVHQLLLVIAIIAFVAAALGWPKVSINLVAAGLVFLTASFIF